MVGPRLYKELMEGGTEEGGSWELQDENWMPCPCIA